MSKDTDHYEGAVLEDIRDKITLLLEATSQLKDVPKRLASIESQLDNMETGY